MASKALLESLKNTKSDHNADNSAMTTEALSEENLLVLLEDIVAIPLQDILDQSISCVMLTTVCFVACLRCSGDYGHFLDIVEVCTETYCTDNASLHRNMLYF